MSKGFDTFDKHDESIDEHLDSLLTTIAAHEQEEGKKIDANIVTWRGMMTKVNDLSAEKMTIFLLYRIDNGSAV